MKRSSRILDQNLRGLMSRAYRPVHPRAEFVQELERTLEPWIGGESVVRVEHSGGSAGRARRRAWFLVSATVAAAAALVLMFGPWREGSGPSRLDEAKELSELLGSGAVALRFDSEQGWRSADADELNVGIPRTGPYLEVATPRALGVRVSDAQGWAVVLEPSSRIAIEVLLGEVHLNLSAGRAAVEKAGGARNIAAPLELHWRDGQFADKGGQLWSVDRAAGGRVEREALVAEEEPLGNEDEESSEPVQDPDRCALIGRVRSADDSVAVTSFDVSLLLAQPLPQVALTETHSFAEIDGSFRIGDLEPGHYGVFVQAQGHSTWKEEALTLVEGQTLELDVLLGVGGVIRGFVLDGATGAGIAGAMVVSESDMPLQIVSLTADEFPPAATAFVYSAHDGSFSLSGMSEGPHRLRANSSEFAPSWQQEVLVQELEVTANVIFELGSGGGIEGRCERDDGTPWASGRLIVSRFSQGSQNRTMTYRGLWTDEEGRYSVEHLSPGAYVVLFHGDVEAGASLIPNYRPVFVEEGAIEHVDFLAAGATLQGRVVDGEGRPEPLANLHLMRLGLGYDDWRGETADEDGAFRLSGLEPGEYAVYAGLAERSGLLETLTLTRGEEVTREFVLEGLSLDVLVTDRDSRLPLPGATLMLFPTHEPKSRLDLPSSRSWLGTDGAYTLSFFEPGTYDLVVVTDGGSHAAHVLKDLRIEEGGELGPIEVVLDPAARVELTVLDQGGQPIEGARATLTDPDGESWAIIPFASTSAAGTVVFGHLAEGAWTAIVKAEGYASAPVVLNALEGVEGRAEVRLRRP